MNTHNYIQPSAEQQLSFLRNIQRILNEGNFVSTYKFALLHVLADLSIIKGDDSGAPLELTTEELATQFLYLYTRQTKPFPGNNAQILKQNTGGQAAIINHISEATVAYGGRVIRPERESALISNIDATIRNMPLWKLQRVGDEMLDLLYENTNEYTCRKIVLKPGVAFCFRTFYEFIISMVQQHWITYVRKYNVDVIGENIDLKDFLFGTKRSNLTPLRQILYDIQDGRCFYTNQPLHGDGEVDHFIPWSRYPSDLGHNFVLASTVANRYKSDHIAAEEHLERWTQFHLDHSTELVNVFDQLNFRYSLETSLQIAQWAYNHVCQAKAQVWIKSKSLRPITSQWQPILNKALQNLELSNF
jgi:hypothetical protein